MKYLDFWQKFLAAEQKADVYKIDTIGFQLYPMLRVRLYYQLAQELGIFENPHPHSESQAEPEVLDSIADLVKEAKIVVVPFVRKVNGVDPYSQAVLHDLGASASLLEISNPAEELDVARIKAYGKKAYDRVVYEAMLQEKVRDVRDRWAAMAAVFESEFGTSLGKFAEFPAWLVRRYISECMAFKEYFEKAKTKKVFIVNAYSHQSLVVGAKQAGVKVIEIQHGFISQYHPAYSFGKMRIQSAPNKILVWGKFWTRNTRFARGTRAKVLGPSQQFLEQRASVQANQKQPRSVLFTSQGALGSELMERAIAWANWAPDYSFTFRLHPNENLADYQRFTLPKNLELSHQTPSFLDLLGQHEILVGGFSTTLYEGVSFGLKVIVLPIAGFENVQPAIDAGDMQLAVGIDGPESLAVLLQAGRTATNPYSYYAEKIDLKEVRRA